MFMPPRCSASSFTPIFTRIEWCSEMARSLSFTSEIFMPSTKLPSSVTEKCLSRPYCEPSSFHQDGVYLPRLSPKSPGLTQVPTSTLLIHMVMSDGQFELVPGVSEESSMLTSSLSTFFDSYMVLFGNLYSKVPLPHQSKPAFMRSGFRKESGMSSKPMMRSVEQRPHGVVTWQSVKIPIGISIST